MDATICARLRPTGFAKLPVFLINAHPAGMALESAGVKCVMTAFKILKDAQSIVWEILQDSIALGVISFYQILALSNAGMGIW